MNAQGSAEWHLDRCGRVTMSEASCVLAKPKTGNGEAVTRRKYKCKVAAERMTGEPILNGFQSADIDRGHDQEPLGRMAYEAFTGLLAIEVPFRKHPTIPLVGASPDGEVDDDGAVEIKCVLPHIQVDTILGARIPPEHVAQVQGVLWVTGRQWCDFISYSPMLPGNLSLYIVRARRDDEYIANLEREVIRFNAEVDELCERLMRMAA